MKPNITKFTQCSKALFLFVCFSVSLSFVGAQNTFPENGKVGIGTTSPEALLHVNGKILLKKAWPTFEIRNTSQAQWGKGRLDFVTTETAASSSVFSIITQKTAAGANTGYASFTISNTLNGKWLTYMSLSEYNSDIIFNSAKSNERSFGNLILKHGNMGIGVTNPGADLHIYGGNAGKNNSLASLMIGKRNGPEIQAVQESNDDDVQGLAFRVKSSALSTDANFEAMRIDKNGSVGIGTSKPFKYSKLDIEGKYQGNHYDAQLHLHTTNNSTGMFLGSHAKSYGVISVGSHYYNSGQFRATHDKSSAIVFNNGKIEFLNHTGLEVGKKFDREASLLLDADGTVQMNEAVRMQSLAHPGGGNYPVYVDSNGKLLTVSPDVDPNTQVIFDRSHQCLDFNQDNEFIVELEKNSFLQKIQLSWAESPGYRSIEVSSNNQNWRRINVGSSTPSANSEELNISTTARYLKLSKYNASACLNIIKIFGRSDLPNASFMDLDVYGKTNLLGSTEIDGSMEVKGAANFANRANFDKNTIFTQKVGIGTDQLGDDFKLSVDGKIRAEEILVQLSEEWPDYVFEQNYDLKSLGEVSQFVSENKHLPGIPSAKEIQTEGISLGQMNALLLEKIEELTLYLIDQAQELKSLKKEIQDLKSHNDE